MTAPEPAPISARLAAFWGGFCLLMMLVGLQERWYAGQRLWPWPVFYEATSMLMATAIAAWRWRRGAFDDAWLAQPRQWFWRVLRWTPLAALAFVAAVYALRHGMRALFGLDYEHQPWPSVLVYECLKFSVFYVLFAGVQYGLRSFRALAAARLRSEQLERLSGQARLAQLTQQMQPHFLFNALNTIAALVHDDPAGADAALVRLAALLRAATDAARRPTHALAAELALAHAYAGLMEQRFGEHVRLHWNEDPLAGTCSVPALSLQPLLENCFVHAVEARRETTQIVIDVQRGTQRLCISVSDDGNGLAAQPGRGVGLGNLRERLQALYGDRASLTLVPGKGGRGAVARLEIPLDA